MESRFLALATPRRSDLPTERCGCTRNPCKVPCSRSRSYAHRVQNQQGSPSSIRARSVLRRWLPKRKAEQPVFGSLVSAANINLDGVTDGADRALLLLYFGSELASNAACTVTAMPGVGAMATSTGHVHSRDMRKAGLVLNLAAIVVITTVVVAHMALVSDAPS